MKQMILCALIASLPITAAAADVEGLEEAILCQGDDDIITITLWTPSQFDEPLHCITSERLSGDANCAPNGGWGLLSAAEVPDLTSVTMDWKTAHEHQWGKLTAIAGPKAVRFNAQYGEGTGSNLSYEWKLTLDRRTGSATWFTKDGDRVPYRCEMQP
ncbi:hypothetical protein SAMN05444851_1489 [Aliiroseovarius sediminilitoris]|uniref:Uncharacterized protein n=1 Tax=Aliiroseovarius sediminilitoris TaxID=1173584 RepID=A0A1I0PB50_9RHOB|nr:hypothetical protein [Aliiroseovarius sediminilitoris]SEW11352.1 hypothetical protein SAMN05444851_1489 [Aliiroseovarius sediminilitoris]